MSIDNKVNELLDRCTDPSISAFLRGVKDILDQRPAAESGVHQFTHRPAKGARGAGQELGHRILGATIF